MCDKEECFPAKLARLLMWCHETEWDYNTSFPMTYEIVSQITGLPIFFNQNCQYFLTGLPIFTRIANFLPGLPIFTRIANFYQDCHFFTRIANMSLLFDVILEMMSFRLEMFSFRLEMFSSRARISFSDSAIWCSISLNVLQKCLKISLIQCGPE